MKKTLVSCASMRLEKVEAIRKALNEGTYKVPALHLAESLLRKRVAMTIQPGWPALTQSKHIH